MTKFILAALLRIIGVKQSLLRAKKLFQVLRYSKLFPACGLLKSRYSIKHYCNIHWRVDTYWQIHGFTESQLLIISQGLAMSVTGFQSLNKPAA